MATKKPSKDSKKQKYTNAEKQAFVKFLFTCCNEIPSAALRMIKPELSIREAMIEAEVLLSDPWVVKEIKKREEDQALDGKKVERQSINDLSAIALVDITDFYYEDEKGKLVLRPLKELTRSQTCAIKKIDISYNKQGKQIIKLELIDKLSAIKLLGSYFKFLNVSILKDLTRRPICCMIGIKSGLKLP